MFIRHLLTRGRHAPPGAVTRIREATNGHRSVRERLDRSVREPVSAGFWMLLAVMLVALVLLAMLSVGFIGAAVKGADPSPIPRSTDGR